VIADLGVLEAAGSPLRSSAAFFRECSAEMGDAVLRVSVLPVAIVFRVSGLWQPLCDWLAAAGHQDFPQTFLRCPRPISFPRRRIRGGNGGMAERWWNADRGNRGHILHDRQLYDSFFIAASAYLIALLFIQLLALSSFLPNRPR